MRAWLTPDTPITGVARYVLYVPDDDTMRSALRGALLLLEQAGNWEQLGDMTPEEAAELWTEANMQTFEMEECPEE